MAQLNFEELLHLPGHPEKGILQFYIDGTTNEFYGADLDNLTGSGGFRAVYYEEIHLAPSHLQSPSEMSAAESLMLPFSGEYALEAEQTEMPMSYMDFRFEPAFLKLYRRHTLADELTTQAGMAQLDTEGMGVNSDICWGDAGVQNFFITPQQLEQRDFSRVLYT